MADALAAAAVVVGLCLATALLYVGIWKAAEWLQGKLLERTVRQLVALGEDAERARERLEDADG